MSEQVPVLVVTGSRVLAREPGAIAWVKSILLPVVEALGDAGGWLYTGGATGPDAWAMDIACAIRRRPALATYRLDGIAYEDCPNGIHRTRPWIGPGELAGLPPRRVPLRRNVAMLRDAREASRRGSQVAVLAFVAPWSATQGTMHTVGLARGARLWTEVHACPSATELRAPADALGRKLMGAAGAGRDGSE